MIYCVRTERANTEKYVESISRGLPNSKLVSYKEVTNSTDAEKVAFMGFLRGGNLVYRWAEMRGVDFYYIDRPYWGESRKTPYWMRCTKTNTLKLLLTVDQTIDLNNHLKKQLNRIIKTENIF